MIEISELSQLDEVVLQSPGGLGAHYLADFRGCQSMPNKADELERQMLEAARRIGATVVSSSFHEFSPHGLSGVVVIAESHLAVHTWPEDKVACVDLFTCSTDMDPRQGLAYLFESFGVDSMQVTFVDRGIKPNSQK